MTALPAASIEPHGRRPGDRSPAPAALAAGPSRRRGRALLLLVAVGGALLVAELLLRAFDLPRIGSRFVSVDYDAGTFEFDRELLWRLAPAAGVDDRNRLGLRGWLPPGGGDGAGRGDEAGGADGADYRIVCVGDSCTFGTGVRVDQTYGARLQRHAQAALGGRPAHCALLALPGYSTYQDRVLVDRVLPTAAADLAVFYCGTWNDFLPALQHTDAAWAEAFSGGRCHLAELFSRALQPELGVQAQQLAEAFVRGEQPRQRRVPLPQFRDNMTAMLEVARTTAQDVLVVLPPLPADTRARFPIADDYRRGCREVAERLSVDVLDAQQLFDGFVTALPPTFRQHAQPDRLLFTDSAHPSAIGHALLAWQIQARRSGRTGGPAVAPTLRGGSVDGVATFECSQVDGALGYAIYYTSEDAEPICGSFEVREARALRVTLPPGTRFHACAQAFDASGAGPMSDVLVLDGN
ncbi:MAG: SGNH/GDSL hydrolase family protein [Planctomycetota bacterium]